MKLASTLVTSFRQAHQLQNSSFHSTKAKRSFLDSIIGSVIKVFTISRTVDSKHPWRTTQAQEFVGSGIDSAFFSFMCFIVPTPLQLTPIGTTVGFVIFGRRIITNAYVVTKCRIVFCFIVFLGELINVVVEDYSCLLYGIGIIHGIIQTIYGLFY